MKFTGYQVLVSKYSGETTGATRVYTNKTAAEYRNNTLNLSEFEESKVVPVECEEIADKAYIIETRVLVDIDKHTREELLLSDTLNKLSDEQKQLLATHFQKPHRIPGFGLT